MRLLNAKTEEFSTFFDADIPKYLVLSHRWEGRETTLQEFEARRHSDSNAGCEGIAKIKRFCEQALQDGCKWVWVDTCCIDKASSAELTEAINSMWRWYANAQACYVYMSDVQPVADEVSKPSSWGLDARLRESAWFTRGWTLQEMLAPRRVVFFDRDWKRLGNRDKAPLTKILQSITDIDRKYFGKIGKIKSACVAERMLWVSQRQTSRIEDIAYCMLGIFDVYMPLIYGEGLNAFLRLQQEIIKVSDDETIFAWAAPGRKRCGPLAEHPWDFSELAGDKIEQKTWIERSPFGMTHKGLELEIFDSPFINTSQECSIVINCHVEGKGWILLDLMKVDGVSWCRKSGDSLRYKQELPFSPSPLRVQPQFTPHIPFPDLTPKFVNEDKQRRMKIFIRQHNNRLM
ncbi:MAG: hypothetical protein LQ340_000721 [Diploschistes diacapsis]|nr:MAG: hypothetical protein LQ340_000721 [Diploschistes diacapsis]